MDRMKIAAIFADQEQLGGKEITVCGWARTIRDMKTFGFIELNAGSCFRNLQVVMSAAALHNYKEIASQNVGAALIVRGTVVLTPEAKQPLELKAAEIAVEGRSTPDYPLQKKRHSVEFLRTIQHLRPRTNLFSATFRVRSAAAYAVHEFFQSRGFVYVHTPIITGSDCEGAGEMFQVTTLDLNNVPKTADGQVDYSQDFFGKKTSLTVSGQLNAENFAMAFGDVYTFGPTFRAENSNTQRHAAEFWMIEPEMAFCDLKGYMDTAEAMTKYVIRYVLDNCPDEMAFFNQFIDKGLIERLELVANSEFGRITYTEAIEILKKNNKKFQFPVEWGVDIQTEHERYLTEVVFKKPVFVTDYPKEIKSFYMKMNADGKTVAAADMLVPGIGELIGGSQREENYDKLVARMDELGMDKTNYEWYLNLRKFGGVEHAVGAFNGGHHAGGAHGNTGLALDALDLPLAVDNILGAVGLGQADHLDPGPDHGLQILDAQAAGQVVDAHHGLLGAEVQGLQGVIHQKTGGVLLGIGHGVLQVEHDGVGPVDVGVADHAGVVAGHEHHTAAQSVFYIHVT